MVTIEDLLDSREDKTVANRNARNSINNLVRRLGAYFELAYYPQLKDKTRKRLHGVVLRGNYLNRSSPVSGDLCGSGDGAELHQDSEG